MHTSPFVDARYFARFAAALRADNPVPRHPFDTYRLEPFLYPEKVAAYQRGVKATPIRELYFAESFVFHGRDPRAMFKNVGAEPPEGSLEEFMAKLTATGSADRFPPFNNAAFKAAKTALESSAIADNPGDLYDAIHNIIDFKPCDWPIPQKKLLLAGASCAAIRAELAVLCAAYTFRFEWDNDPTLAATPLGAISSKIFELCHQTYVLNSEHWTGALKTLPKTKKRQFVTDQHLMAGQYLNTVNALSSDEGLWFLFGSFDQERGLAYLSRNGSIFQTDIVGLLEEDHGREIHRFAGRDPGLLPERFVRGKDQLYSF